MCGRARVVRGAVPSRPTPLEIEKDTLYIYIHYTLYIIYIYMTHHDDHVHMYIHISGYACVRSD